MGITINDYFSFLKKETSRKKIFLSPSEKAVKMIRKAQLFSSKNALINLISKYYVNKLVKEYGIFIHPECTIGIGLRLPHPNGIIIGKAVSIGSNCTIYQQVTVGSARKGDYKVGKQPIIKDNVVLFAGAKVIGDIALESGTIVGANSVLNTNTEENSVYAGVVAKRIR